MAASSDVRDILELENRPDHEFVTKESLMNDSKKVQPICALSVWNLLCHEEMVLVAGHSVPNCADKLILSQSLFFSLFLNQR